MIESVTIKIAAREYSHVFVDQSVIFIIILKSILKTIFHTKLWYLPFLKIEKFQRISHLSDYAVTCSLPLQCHLKVNRTKSEISSFVGFLTWKLFIIRLCNTMFLNQYNFLEEKNCSQIVIIIDQHSIGNYYHQ